MTRGALDPVDAALDRIDAWQGSTNAFSQVYADQARAEADAVDPDRSLHLAGVPIAVKELFDVDGHPTTGCCAAIPPEPAERDASLVARLRAQGAIVIGKTNQHELAAGVTNLESSCGPTRNPWDPNRISGGSSGGSAVAVATGIVPISLVSDTGGSARIPAALCGAWGLKPTTGALPAEGMMPLAPEMDCPGLLAGSPGDLRRAWEALSGRTDAGPVPSVVGVLRGGRWERCHVGIRAAVDRAADRLRDAGVEVREVDGSDLDDVHHVWNRIAWPSFAERYADLIGNPALGPTASALLGWGAEHRDERPRARARAEAIRGWFAQTFRTVDLLLTATAPYVAPAIGAAEVDLGDGSTMDVDRGGPSWFTTAANVGGLPALAVPFSTSAEGLPLSVQVMAPIQGEDALLEAAEILRTSGSTLPRPTVPTG
ncbi:MAG TPA: amidase [Actinomycetota bacterium]|nr:amidase [Actinomycetota bacterium]